MRRFVVFFTSLTKVVGSKKRKQVTVRTAKGPVDAYRKATGWLGPVGCSNGYSNQVPARSVQGFYRQPIDGPAYMAWLAANKNDPVPPHAYIIPLGKW